MVTQHTITLKNGMELKLVPIRELAEALGRTSGAVRKWEYSGVLPQSGFRDKNNNRLYSEDQLKAVRRVAEEVKLTPGKPQSFTRFGVRIAEEFAKLNKIYNKE